MRRSFAAISFLARYSGRTLEAYRDDLLGFFQWAIDHGITVMQASRAHIELFRAWMEDRGLAASTIDRRLSTVCGFYRFAHIDGRIRSNPAQYVRRPQVHASDARGLDRSELGVFLFTAEQYDRDHAALAVLLGLNGLRVSEACATNVEDLGLERGHRTLRIVGKGNKPATVPLVPRTARTIDLAVGERHEGPILRRRDGHRVDRRTAHRWVRSIGKRAGLGRVHPHMLRAAFIMAALDAGVPLRDLQIAARHADPRTTTIYDRRRQNFDRHAATSSSPSSQGAEPRPTQRGTSRSERQSDCPGDGTLGPPVARPYLRRSAFRHVGDGPPSTRPRFWDTPLPRSCAPDPSFGRDRRLRGLLRCSRSRAWTNGSSRTRDGRSKTGTSAGPYSPRPGRGCCQEGSSRRTERCVGRSSP
jgi:integrase/recombinase XerD